MITSISASMALIAMGFWGHSYVKHADNTQAAMIEHLLAPQVAPNLLVSEEPSSSSGSKLDNVLALLTKYQGSLIKPSRPFRIMQIGDSHTAGDFFTEEVRFGLQRIYGDAGIGWILPGDVPGQRASRYQVSQTGEWTLTNTNSANPKRDLPLGGYINTGKSGGRIDLRPLIQGAGNWRIHALVRSSAVGSVAQVQLERNGTASFSKVVNDQWAEVSFPSNQGIAKYYSLAIKSGTVDVAGFWLERDEPGIVLDHVGRNGATLDVFSRWSDHALTTLLQSRPIDVFILQFGTNEAVGSISLDRYFSLLTTVINRLQKLSPNSSIILITPPSFSPNGFLSCGASRPHSIQSVIQAQLLAGQRDGVTTWNWQQAMGGECAVSPWAKQGLMSRDYIHLSPSGYRKSADLFLKWITTPLSP